MTETAPVAQPAQPDGATHHGMTATEERQYAMFIHLSALSAIVIGIGIIAGPLILWLVKKEESAYVDAHGKAAVNFQLSVVLYIVAAMVIGFIFFFTIIGIPIAFLLWILAFCAGVAAMILAVVAGIKANNGEAFQYPLAIPFLK